MKDKNFTLAFQVIADDDRNGKDFNFRVPPKFGRWIATMRTTDFDKDETIKQENKNNPILSYDEYANFVEEFGV